MEDENRRLECHIDALMIQQNNDFQRNHSLEGENSKLREPHEIDQQEKDDWLKQIKELKKVQAEAEASQQTKLVD